MYYVVLRDYQLLILISNHPRHVLHKYVNEDVSLGSWLIGLDVEHIDDRRLCCGTPPGNNSYSYFLEIEHFLELSVLSFHEVLIFVSALNISKLGVPFFIFPHLIVFPTK